ncbi:MAG: hypothetical protein H6618_02305 [Deltaproteobacteria bacterium]|nr:hypothetical protein [Deltaproteobacteria bacterium]
MKSPFFQESWSERLQHEISAAAQRQADIRQLACRYKELLPDRLKQLTAEYRRQRHPAGKATRMALKDPRYLKWLDELAELSSEALKTRIRWEHLRMLWDARKSSGLPPHSAATQSRRFPTPYPAGKDGSPAEHTSGKAQR